MKIGAKFYCGRAPTHPPPTAAAAAAAAAAIEKRAKNRSSERIFQNSALWEITKLTTLSGIQCYKIFGRTLIHALSILQIPRLSPLFASANSTYTMRRSIGYKRIGRQLGFNSDFSGDVRQKLSQGEEKQDGPPQNGARNGRPSVVLVLVVGVFLRQHLVYQVGQVRLVRVPYPGLQVPLGVGGLVGRVATGLPGVHVLSQLEV